MNFKLRPVDSTDFTFLYTLHRAALGPYVEKLWGWDDDWQRMHYEANYRPTIMRIIQVVWQDAGMVSLAEYDEYFLLRQIEILPRFQGHGLGSAVIHHLQEQAADAGKFLLLRVFKINPAQHLYLRLGFRIISEDDVHLTMRWDAEAITG
ncbi:MAG: GNAT family N-acetyltransferase [Anaerolineae bacterium]|nr:GNAT family N-acetyltransferase [Anaerolineae bacterium]